MFYTIIFIVIKFTKNIIEDKPIEIFNHGNHFRDFTYVDDIVKGIYLATKKNQKSTNFKIYNLGKGQTISLKKFISQIEFILNKKAIKNNTLKENWPEQEYTKQMSNVKMPTTCRMCNYVHIYIHKKHLPYVHKSL